MRALIVRDDGELRRIERVIAEFEGRPPAERLRKSCLLQALRRERAELLRCSAGRAWQAPAAGAIVGRAKKKRPSSPCSAFRQC